MVKMRHIFRICANTNRPSNTHWMKPGSPYGYRYLQVDADNFWQELYVTTVGCLNYPAGRPYPASGRPDAYNFDWNRGRVLGDFAIVLLSRGAGTFETRTSMSICRAGDVLLIPPEVWHRYRPGLRQAVFFPFSGKREPVPLLGLSWRWMGPAHDISPKGQWLAVDFAAMTAFDRITMPDASHSIDQFRIEATVDGFNWRTIAEVGEMTRPSTATFTLVTARQARIFLLRTHASPLIESFEVRLDAKALRSP